MQSKDTAHHHTARRFCSSSSTELALTQRTTQVQQASRCSMNPQQSRCSSSDVGGGERHSARVTDDLYIRAARNWGEKIDFHISNTHSTTTNNNTHHAPQHSTRPSFQRPTPLCSPTDWWQALTRWMPARYTLRPQRALLVARLPSILC